MKNKTNLQVPISTKIKKLAEVKAEAHGFSSVQELVRVFLASFANDDVNLIFSHPVQSKMFNMYDREQEIVNKGLRDGTVKTYTAEEFIDHLDKL
jgi:hypothetical protein